MLLKTILCKFGQICAKVNASGNGSMQAWMNLCYKKCFYETNCWQELLFENFRQNLNESVLQEMLL